MSIDSLTGSRETGWQQHWRVACFGLRMIWRVSYWMLVDMIGLIALSPCTFTRPSMMSYLRISQPPSTNSHTYLTFGCTWELPVLWLLSSFSQRKGPKVHMLGVRTLYPYDVGIRYRKYDTSLVKETTSGAPPVDCDYETWEALPCDFGNSFQNNRCLITFEVWYI